MARYKDGKKRQRLQALYVVVSERARYRQELAAMLGVHRHSVAAWLAAYTAGGLHQMLSYHVPRPPTRSRITPTALRATRSYARGWPSSIRCMYPIQG
jgi:hypothetical protein